MNRLLFFYSNVCPPCKYFKKEFILPLKKIVGNGRVVEYEAEENREAFSIYNVSKTPWCILVDDERKIINSAVGITDFNYCTKMLGGEIVKVEFLKKCKDKITDELYNVGQVVEFEANRGKEIVEAHGGNYAREVKSTKTKKVKE